MTFYQKFTKPLLDYIFSFVLIILCLPAFIILSMTILIIDGAPIIFKQKRIGRFGREFIIYKFKTMEASKGPLLTFDNDKRITKLGRILRKYKFDELPQFFNILKGDMSFIGPRPVPFLIAQKRLEEKNYLFNIKPGITGLGTIEFADEAKYLKPGTKNIYEIYTNQILPRKIQIDRIYAKKSCFITDTLIILRTIKIIFALFK